MSDHMTYRIDSYRDGSLGRIDAYRDGSLGKLLDAYRDGSLGFPLHMNGRLVERPMTIEHMGRIDAFRDGSLGSLGGPRLDAYRDGSLGSESLDAYRDGSLGGPLVIDGQVMPGHTRIVHGPVGEADPVDPLGPTRAALSTARSFVAVAPLYTAAIAACAYHGYKRSQSVSGALLWALAGIFWPIALPVAVAQGFGQPKGMRANAARRKRSQGKALKRIKPLSVPAAKKARVERDSYGWKMVTDSGAYLYFDSEKAAREAAAGEMRKNIGAHAAGLGPVGIPYASTKFDGRGRAYQICPLCNETIYATQRKDGESFSGAEYAQHWATAHPGQNRMKKNATRKRSKKARKPKAIRRSSAGVLELIRLLERSERRSP